MTLEDMGRSCYNNAVIHGFYEDYERVMGRLKDFPEDQTFLKQIWLSHRLMLIVSELAEGLEAIRDHNYSCAPKSGGLGEELVDAKIRLADLFAHCIPEMDQDVAVHIKMDYNATRPYKHNRSL